MNSLTQIVEMRTRLFSQISIPRRSAPRVCKPIVPNKVKFIVNPAAKQILFPGLYFEIPHQLSINEMETLEQAILKVLNSDPVELKPALDVPQSLARKLSESSSPLLNGFVRKKSKLYLQSANCLLVSSDERLRPTSIKDPEYGDVLSLLDTACCIAFMAAASSIDRCGITDTRNIMFERIWSKLEDAVAPVSLERARLCKSVLHIGNIGINRFADEDVISPFVSAILCSFLWMETDTTKFLEW